MKPGILLSQFMELARQVKKEGGYKGGCLLVEGKIGGKEPVDIFWEDQTGKRHVVELGAARKIEKN